MRDGYALATAAYLVLLLLGALPHAATDTHAYWANTLPDPYASRIYDGGNGFYYAPPFAQAFWPLTFLPFPVVATAWAAMLLAVLWRLVGAWAPVALLFVPVSIEIYFGNVNLLFAGVAVWGLRMPWMWVLPLFTKVTPGIGLVWFVARREWRALGIAGLVTGLVATASVVVAPSLWRSWVALLQSNVDTGVGLSLGPMWARVTLAAAIVAWGGVTGRTWTIPVAMVVAAPRLWLATLAVLAAVPALGNVQPAPLRHRGPLERPSGPIATPAPRESVDQLSPRTDGSATGERPEA